MLRLTRASPTDPCSDERVGKHAWEKRDDFGKLWLSCNSDAIAMMLTGLSRAIDLFVDGIAAAIGTVHFYYVKKTVVFE